MQSVYRMLYCFNYGGMRFAELSFSDEIPYFFLFALTAVSSDGSNNNGKSDIFIALLYQS